MSRPDKRSQAEIAQNPRFGAKRRDSTVSAGMAPLGPDGAERLSQTYEHIFSVRLINVSRERCPSPYIPSRWFRL